MPQKRVLTIQDYSCMGRCSLTVAIPTLSALGIETIGLPTAVLSNHTQFASWTFIDLTSSLIPSVEKWKSYNHHFDFLYTGYLATNQIEIVASILARLKEEGTKVYIDPAFADNGKMYPGFQDEHPLLMRKLIAIADYVKPNLSEACFLTGTPIPASGKVSKEEAMELAKKIQSLGAKNVILSGLSFKEGKLDVLLLEEGKGFSLVEGDKLEGLYHGTGDLFSSAVVGKLTLGKDLKSAVEDSHNYIASSIRYTVEDKLDGLLYGVEFEKALPELLK